MKCGAVCRGAGCPANFSRMPTRNAATATADPAPDVEAVQALPIDYATATAPSRFRWVVLALVFFAITINYIDRMVMGLVAPELRELRVHVELLAHPVGLHLEEERAGLEDVAVLARDAARAVHVALPGEARHLAGEARGEAHEALRVIAQELLVDARVVVEALGERL